MTYRHLKRTWERHNSKKGNTYSPLNRKKAEQESDPRVPASSLIDDTSGSEHITRGVHVGACGRREEHDSDDCDIEI